MLRYLLAALAVFVLLTVSLVPDDAFARRGGGGFHGGGARAGGFHGGGFRGGAVHAGRIHGGHRVARGARPAHPIAGRPGRYPVAGRPGRPVAGYPGYRPGYGWGRAAYGAAAVGAAAAGAYGAYGYYNNGCYQDTYGNWVCPHQNPYRY
ncbi:MULTISPECIES: hypothetical protein [Bradyrhizobium]|uniref:Uncharacterized protein n=1 Tax=Bradyrhizobium vignae TaxID=1549949 RepID=A0A2U3PWC4_9BRAD|nr:hypothetical protein [Bradyrhizobium vignae]MBP0113440.1 hypothetical protein [Bradyrhizobium vignae]RXG97428.1 hypothetical protein EAV90_22400 [Bradyrhizobium vignae]SPP93408.1 conserved protein of unknown function [Bradyrhizobium vignae]